MLRTEYLWAFNSSPVRLARESALMPLVAQNVAWGLFAHKSRNPRHRSLSAGKDFFVPERPLGAYESGRAFALGTYLLL